MLISTVHCKSYATMKTRQLENKLVDFKCIICNANMQFTLHITNLKSCSVDRATCYGSDGRRICVPLPGGATEFSLLHGVHTGSGAHPASCPVGTTGTSFGDEAAGA
jgi:hypothetical protein